MSRGGYAVTADGVYIAFREWGEKDPVHVYLSEVGASVDTRDMHPSFIRIWRQLGAISRTVSLDRRGTGASDAVTPYRFDNLDDTVLDILAVVDKVGAQQVVLSGEGSSGAAAVAFAVAHPERVSRLILFNSAARATRSDDYPIAPFSDDDIALIAASVIETWGDGSFIANFAPNLASDPTFIEVCGRVERLVASPTAFSAFCRDSGRLDIRDLVTKVSVPTLVYFTGDLMQANREQSVDLAERIPDARFIDAAGGLFYQPDGSPQLDELAAFIGGTIEPDPTEHATVLFLDVVDSTALAARVGDATWLQTLDDFDTFVRTEVDRHNGRVVNFTGDGHVAMFASPRDAIETALRLSGGVGALGLQIRVGVHLGSVAVRRSGDVGGMAVHIGARVLGVAGTSEVLVSEPVAVALDLRDVDLEDRGEFEFKGIGGRHRLFACVRSS